MTTPMQNISATDWSVQPEVGTKVDAGWIDTTNGTVGARILPGESAGLPDDPNKSPNALYSLFTKLLNPPTPETETTPRTETMQTNDGGTYSLGKVVSDVANDMLRSVGQRAVEVARKTPAGQAAENEWTRQKIQEILSNPLVILIFILGLIFLGVGLGKLAR